MSDQYTDAEVAGMVRMLMRDQADHEMICVLARDRILEISGRLAQLQADLKESQEKFAEMLTNRDYWQERCEVARRNQVIAQAKLENMAIDCGQAEGSLKRCRKDLQATQEELQRARKNGEELRGALDEMYMGAIARMGLDKARAKYSRQYAALASQPPSAGEEGK